MRRFSRCILVAALTYSSIVNVAYGQEKPQDPTAAGPDKTDEAARVLFDAGAKAYAAGLYSDAVAAFREAHSLAPDRPTVLFSLAQAERRQYTVKPDPEMLEAAIAHFRKYLDLVVEGGRRADVVVALGELEALRAGTASPIKKAARIFITTETPAAVIFVDGVQRHQVPVIEEAPPGKHEIKVEAPGFITDSREIVAVEGTIFPLEINLREKPSFLSLKAPSGASINVDGRVYGEAPLQTPLELSSGAHRLVILQRGYVPFDERISLQRAWTSSVNVSLKMTTQRKVSYFLLGTSVVSFGFGAVFAATAIARDSTAGNIYSQAKTNNITETMLERYQTAKNSRDNFIGSSIGMMFLALGLGVASGATYWFDSSARLSGSSVRNDAHISVTPVWGGAFVSVGRSF